MLSLLELVAQNQPHFQTHKALLVLGLQNDFLHPDGKLPINSHHTFLERLDALIPAFRKQSSNVIWVKTIYEADRLACDPSTGEGDAVVVGALADGDESTDDDVDLRNLPPVLSKSTKHRNRALGLLKRVSARRRSIQGFHPEPAEPSATAEDDEELFLRQSARAGPACQVNTNGAEFIDEIKPKIDKTDTVVQTTHYSAFQGTSLLLILRARLVTELYICGCITNISVLATVVDAARHGIKLNVVSDCLGYRKRSRHKLALRRMEDFFDADIVTSEDILNPKPDHEEEQEDEPNSTQNGSPQEESLQGLVDRLRLADPNKSSGAARERSESHSNTVNGRPPKPSSSTAAAESSASADAKTTDQQFTDLLVQGARVPGAEHQPRSDVKNDLVKTKVRMRSRTDKSKKEESKRSKGEPSKQGAEASPSRAGSIERPEPIKSNKGANRHTSTPKAEGSDKLGDSPTKSHSLKSAVSQPTLSAPNTEGRDKSTTSRVRLALTRSPKSDSNKEAGASPARSTASLSSTTPNQVSEKTEPAKMVKNTKLQSLATFPTLGPDDKIAEGDSRILYNFFPPEFYHPTDRSKPLKDLIFTQLYNEVRWQTMMHQQGEVPRLVCCQGEYGADGSTPVYRHPADQMPPVLHFSSKVQIIRKQAEKLVGHPLNHVLIQLYRSGNDYISEHSDKTLDIVKGSSIVNVSFGAQRTMRLRKKKASQDSDSMPSTLDSSETPSTSTADTQRETERVAMPHNSMFILGLRSNEKWLHGIMADKRLPSERSAAEKAYSGIRISLTFRHIGTYLDARSTLIWGQGATSKDQREAGDIINNDAEETTRMVQAFSRENHDADFNWNAHYGEGFDVLHLSTPPPDLPMLFATSNRIDTSAIKIFLAEAKIPYILHPPPSQAPEYEIDRQIHFRDNDVSHTEVSIHVPTIAYLDRYYPLDTDPRGNSCTSASYEIFIQISALIKYWLNRHVPTYKEDFEAQLEVLEEKQSFGGPFVGGRRFSSGDCQMWAAIDELVGEWEDWDEERFPRLTEYWRMVWKKKRSIREVKGELGERALKMLKAGEEAREQL